ncbi:MAG: NfeD family protein [Elusimicrobia bacterium]|nr:NfeD family protein [Elusimicrobiota bacterium]
MFEHWLAWAVVAVVLVIIEIISPTVFFFVCLAIGAIFASIATIFHIAWLPWVVFITISFLLVVFARPLINKFVNRPGRPANVDALVGQRAYVLEEVKPTRYGRIKVEGEEWIAESPEEITKDTWVKITEIKGTRVVVEKTDQ